MTGEGGARLKALIAVAAWGGSFPAIKVALAEVSLTTLIWLRFGSGVLALFLIIIARKKGRFLPFKEAFLFAALGFLGIFFHNAIQAFALKTVSAGMSGLIIATNPIAIAALGALILGERIDRGTVGGILLAAIGVLVILARGDPSFLLLRGFSTGELLMIFSVFTWGLFTVISRKALQRTPPELAMIYALSFGWFYSTVPFLYCGGVAELPAISAAAWMNILFLGVFCSGLAYFLWYDALRVLPASEVGVFLYINPVVAVILSAAFLGEAVTPSMILGGALVFLGVWFVNTRQRRSRITAE
ncbi:MAG: DMT family transporter [Aminivibrio sp.]|jgi:drug/metabolite transporter (DMT)-like permease